jgi:hypothetical protein
MSPTTDGSKERQHDAGGTDAEQPAHGRAGVLSMENDGGNDGAEWWAFCNGLIVGWLLTNLWYLYG